jgi:hypothetical protein
VLQVGSDHRAEFLAPDMEDAGVKQLGQSALGRRDVDLSARAAGEEGDSEVRQLGQPQRPHLAATMQGDQPATSAQVVYENSRVIR